MTDTRKIVEKLIRDARTSLYMVAILKILVDRGPLHGYGIRKLLHELSNGKPNPSESTVYDVLKRLEKLGLIESYWGESPFEGLMRKYYRAREGARESA